MCLRVRTDSGGLGHEVGHNLLAYTLKQCVRQEKHELWACDVPSSLKKSPSKKYVRCLTPRETFPQSFRTAYSSAGPTSSSHHLLQDRKCSASSHCNQPTWFTHDRSPCGKMRSSAGGRVPLKHLHSHQCMSWREEIAGVPVSLRAAGSCSS